MELDTDSALRMGEIEPPVAASCLPEAFPNPGAQPNVMSRESVLAL